MRKGWKTTANILLSALRDGQAAFREAAPLPELEEIDYSVVTPEEEWEIRQRRAEAIDQYERATSGGLAFLTAWWGTAHSSDRGERLLDRLVRHPDYAETADLTAQRRTNWRGESEWADPCASDTSRKVRVTIELRSRVEDAGPYVAVLRHLGSLLVAPPKTYVARCSTNFPVGSNRSQEFNGALWLLSDHLQSGWHTNQSVGIVASDFLDHPVSVPSLPFTTAEWRRVFGNVRRVAKEGHGFSLGLSLLTGGASQSMPSLLAGTKGASSGWLPPFDESAPWAVLTQTAELATAGISLLERVLKPQDMDLPNDLITKAEAARRARVGPATVYRWINAGLVREYGPGKLLSSAEALAVPRGVSLSSHGMRAKLGRKKN